MGHRHAQKSVRARRRVLLASTTVLSVAVALTTTVGSVVPARADAPPPATLHYTANGVFNGSTYAPGPYGFNLADIESTWYLSQLPADTAGLVWIGTCNGANGTFVKEVKPYLNNPKVFGYYLYDEPDPTGLWKTRCTAGNLKAESDWIHSHDPGKKTFVLLMNMSSSSNPSYQGTYNPANTGIDLYGLDPYPCRTDLASCDYSYITKDVAAAEAWHIPAAQIVPVFQTFGGGGWTDDSGGKYALPTADELQQILDVWATVVPHPVFDYAYSWGIQNNDDSLAGSPDLLTVMADHNAAA